MSEEPVEDFKASRKKHYLVSAALVTGIVAVISALGVGLKLDPNKSESALLLKPAKDFSVSWLQGKEMIPNAGPQMTLQDFHGQPLVLNYWASWCISCKQEATLLEAYWQKYKDTGLKIVGIAIQDSPENAIRFAKYYNKTYILALDDEKGTAGIDYGITAVPETFFINREGVIIHKEAGPIYPELMDKMIPKILN